MMMFVVGRRKEASLMATKELNNECNSQFWRRDTRYLESFLTKASDTV